jgi:hypothetical protein
MHNIPSQDRSTGMARLAGPDPYLVLISLFDSLPTKVAGWTVLGGELLLCFIE